MEFSDNRISIYVNVEAGLKNISAADRNDNHTKAFCPKCGSYDIRFAGRARIVDAIAKHFSLLALHCRACQRRFYGRADRFGKVVERKDMTVTRVVKKLAVLSVLLMAGALAGYSATIVCPGTQTLQAYLRLGACQSGIFTVSAFHFGASGTTGGTTGLLTASQIMVDLAPDDDAFDITFVPVSGKTFVAVGNSSGTHTATYDFWYTLTAPAGVEFGSAAIGVKNGSISCSPNCGGLASYNVASSIDGSSFLMLPLSGDVPGPVDQSISSDFDGQNRITFGNAVTLTGQHFGFTVGGQSFNFNGTAQIGYGSANPGGIRNVLVTIPEPATLLMAGSALIMFGTLLKKRRQA